MTTEYVIPGDHPGPISFERFSEFVTFLGRHSSLSIRDRFDFLRTLVKEAGGTIAPSTTPQEINRELQRLIHPHG